ncbi:CerR family C-terminal domain-containing protein [Singulisphaera sp. PoT]|uniref:CerR family C-terminal domain-containing protein n=1 Tax=Singulisphaera sp. PoT TaxID=3411797 RepID=UPI003BF4968D
MGDQDLTKARLLEAAGEEFAEKGYESARIRSICQKAGANLAAVNYHFGDKEQLYIATVLHAHHAGAGAMPEWLTSQTHGPATQLRLYIRHFLTNIFKSRHHKDWQQALILREMIQPTAASEAVVREAIRPRFERLMTILRQICPEAEERRLHALIFSVVGQCLHYKVCRPISELLVGPESYEALDIDFLADHIASFCLAALGQGPTLNEQGQFAADDPAFTR